VANVKKNFSMPERSAQLIEQYAKEVGLSQSAFVSLMVTQINQVVKSLPKLDMVSEVNARLSEKESDTGPSGDD
jgi:DNA primase large subunit